MTPVPPCSRHDVGAYVVRLRIAVAASALLLFGAYALRSSCRTYSGTTMRPQSCRPFAGSQTIRPRSVIA